MNSILNHFVKFKKKKKPKEIFSGEMHIHNQSSRYRALKYRFDFSFTSLEKPRH